jgi:hypothetical protein
VGFKFGGGREREDMKILSCLPIPCLFMAPDAWYERTVRTHPARTRCSRLRTKAVDAVRPGGTIVSPVPMVGKLTVRFPENLKFLLSGAYNTFSRTNVCTYFVTWIVVLVFVFVYKSLGLSGSQVSCELDNVMKVMVDVDSHTLMSVW